ncbi:MAG: 50S ribosomal protein L25/general stress protein Ctc [Archangiaceae bacterium]|nr:50S ribosomal protein L25/general stress protein Ctc [Archangiaceae bacterium]
MAATQSQLEAKVREGSGKGSARKARAAGMIPAIVYGKHLEKPLQISIDPKAVKTAVNTTKRLNTVIGLKVGSASHIVLLKEYQQDPVTRELLHADFIDVRENEQVKVKVPVLLVGKAEGQGQGGILSQMRRELEVWALPAAIPDKIEVDVTPLKIGHSLHINDVKMPAGITVKTQVNYTLAVVTAPEAEVVATPAATAAVPGAEGAAAAGAAPAAGAKAGDAKAGDAKAGDAKAGDAKAAPAAKADAKKK